MIAKDANNIWNLVGEEFDEKLPRRTAILVKPNDDSLHFAYPAKLGTLGYYFDLRDQTTYEETPTFKIEMSPFIYPGLSPEIVSRSTYYYSKQKYYPSLIERELVFSSLGIEMKETFARVRDNSFTWRLRFNSRNVHHFLEKKFYLIVSGEKKFDEISIKKEAGLFRVLVGGKSLILKAVDVDGGIYDTVDAYEDDIFQGKLSQANSCGKYLVLELGVKLPPGKSTAIQIGISLADPLFAERAFSVKDLAGPIRRRWNSRFSHLPEIKFRTEEERKAYYKCWWIIKLNYYHHPEHGPTVLEALPVYRGYWLWGMPAVEWHSSQNREHASKFIKKVIELFLDNQREDGYLTHAIYLDENIPGERWSQSNTTQTPHIPWVALRYYYVTGDKESLQKWYSRLVKFYEYLTRSRDAKGLHLWAILTSFDTGLDTTSAFDKVTYGIRGRKEAYCYPAIFAAERYRYELALAKISEILGKGEDGAWLEEAQKTKESLDKYLWDTKRKWYGVLHENGRLDTRVGIDGLFPFTYKVVNKSQAKEARSNFQRLIGQYGIYTIAPGEKGFREETYWRGPTWSKSCSCAVATARNYYPELLSQVTQSTINMLLAHPSIWECMSARTAKIGRGDIGIMATPVVSSNVGAGEALGAILTAYGIDMFSIEDVFELVEVKNFHWAGFWLDVSREKSHYLVMVRKGEKKEGDITFRFGGKVITISVEADKEYIIR